MKTSELEKQETRYKATFYSFFKKELSMRGDTLGEKIF